MKYKYYDPCEWNPKENRECYNDEIHAQADYIVGANGQFRLCESCSKLKRFKRYKKTKIKRDET